MCNVLLLDGHEHAAQVKLLNERRRGRKDVIDAVRAEFRLRKRQRRGGKVAAGLSAECAERDIRRKRKHCDRNAEKDGEAQSALGRRFPCEVLLYDVPVFCGVIREERRERKRQNLCEKQQRNAVSDITHDQPAETGQQTETDEKAETG